MPSTTPHPANDHETLLLVQQQIAQILTLVRETSAGVVNIEKRLTHMEHHQALADQAALALRQDVAAATAKADHAHRTAQGVGKALDAFRDSVERDKARIAGQVSVIHWIGALVVTVLTALVISFLTGVLHL